MDVGEARDSVESAPNETEGIPKKLNSVETEGDAGLMKFSSDSEDDNVIKVKEIVVTPPVVEEIRLSTDERKEASVIVAEIASDTAFISTKFKDGNLDKIVIEEKPAKCSEVDFDVMRFSSDTDEELNLNADKSLGNHRINLQSKNPFS